jgi:HAD superfamily hydrolase (TIGR01490 family)
MRGRHFAVFDIDGTLIRWQLYHAIADALARSGHIKPESYQAMRDSRMQWKKRSGGSSFKVYEKQLILTYEEVLSTLSLEQFNEAVDAVFNEYKDQVYTYTRDLLVHLKKEGYLLFAISGSQTEIVAKIASYYGFDDYVGTAYEYKYSRFTGKKSVGSLNKAATLKDLVDKYAATYAGSVGVGDSESDAKMLELVDKPIAFNPERALFANADVKGWKIVLERKNVVYELEKKDGKYQLVTSNTR